jgi:hypothetical protein
MGQAKHIKAGAKVRKGLVLFALLAWWLEIYTPSERGLRKTKIGPHDSEATCQVKQNEVANIVGVVVGPCYDESKLPTRETQGFGRGADGLRQDPEAFKQGIR